ncbi:uncharacterized protein [Rutidosis leptorrhynchoides]|uniref:uncharacterized protein n=1 Tax=Rutidosis leptorrhynchoides TaxID=125765 RepID=UPI003A9954F4
MAGTLYTKATITSFRNNLNSNGLFRTSSIRSKSSVHYTGTYSVPKASLHAVIDEPAVESMKMKNMSLYDVLNVNHTATPSQIKSAYRSLAKRYHPDASYSKQNDDRDFIEIQNAYATLSDPTSRALYDLKLSTGIERRSGGLYAGNSYGYYTGRRWETDQCW